MRKTAAQLADDITSLASELTGQSDNAPALYMVRLAKAVQAEAARRSGDNEVHLSIHFYEWVTNGRWFVASIAVKPPRVRNRFEMADGSSADSAIAALAEKLGVTV